MPLRFSTLYRKNKKPSRDFFSYWVWGKEFLPACSAALSAAGGGKRRRILRQQKGKAENFSTLKEKLKKERARQKMKGKIFCFARRKAGAAAGRDCRLGGGNYPAFRWKKVRAEL
jgi:hypothetical protein